MPPEMGDAGQSAPVASSLNDLANGTGTLPPATTENSSTNPQPAQTSPEAAPEGGQKPAQNPVEQGYDPEWWRKDARFGKMWNSEGDIIKSYHEADKILESKYKPAYKQYEVLQKKFKDYGLSEEAFDDYVKEYTTLKSPENPQNKRASYLGNWIDNPLYRDKVVKFFQDLEVSELDRMYPNMTSEARQKMIELESRVSEFEKATKEQQQSKMVAEYKNNINTNLKEISKIAESKGFEFNDNIKNEFLDYCSQNGVPPNLMVGEFIRKFNEGLDKSYENKIKSKFLEEQAKNSKTNISFSKPKIEQQNAKKGFVDRLSEAMAGKNQT